MSRLTFDAKQDNSNPVWSPDGKRIAFGSLRNGKWGIYLKRADGTGNEELLVESDLPKGPTSWSPDGESMVYFVVDPKTKDDQWVVPLTGDRKPFPILQSPFIEHYPQISPDGKWMAYASDETGRREIYVRPFPKGAGKWQISTNGGVFPRWRGDSKELFYVGNTRAFTGGKIIATEIRAAGSSIERGAPRDLFDAGTIGTGHGALQFCLYAVSPDGQRFLISRPEANATREASPAPITVVLNWQAVLNKK
jgi:Tol biopolymer transport system component